VLVANVTIRFTHADGETTARAQTDHEGRFEARGMIEGEYVAQAFRVIDYQTVWVECGRIAARAKDVELRLVK
jgi:hypothetical protein